MSGAALPDGIHALWPDRQSFQLGGNNCELVVTGQVTDIRNDRRGLWMNLDGLAIAGHSIWLDQVILVFVPAEVLVRELLSSPSA